MKITSIELVSVPFDNSYRNVFSAIDNKGKFINDYKLNLYSFYQNNFPSTLQFSGAKSVKRSELGIKFNIAINSSTNVYEYNYVITTSDYGIEFWFIASVEELNSCSTHVNYRFILENDVWSNYQHLVYNEKRNQLVENMHIQQFDYDFDGNIVVKNGLKVYNQQLSFDYSQVETYENIKVLWIKITTITGTYWYKDLDDTQTELIKRTFYSQSFSPSILNTFYIPYCVYIGKDIVDIDNVSYSDGETFYYPYQTIYQDNDFKTEDIVETSLTYATPFDYTVTGNLARVFITIKDPALVVEKVYNSNEEIILQDVVSVYDRPSTHIENTVFEGNITPAYHHNLTYDKLYLDVDTKFSYISFLYNNPLCNTYPFSKFKFRFGTDNDIDVVPSHYDDEIKVSRIANDDGCYYYIEGIRNAKEFDSKLTPFITNNSGGIPITSSQYDIYMRNNGQRMSQNIVNAKERADLALRVAKQNYIANVRREVKEAKQGVGNFVGGIASGDYDTALSGATEIGATATDLIMTSASYKLKQEEINLAYKHAVANNESLIYDLKNQKDIISYNGGNFDTYYQDGFIAIEYDIKDVETVRNIETIKTINLFGFTINSYRDITEFPMRNYTYIKTIDSNLTCGKNLAIKNALETILNNGVRCWRISANNDYVKNMDYNCSNYINTEAIPHEYTN